MNRSKGIKNLSVANATQQLQLKHNLFQLQQKVLHESVPITILNGMNHPSLITPPRNGLYLPKSMRTNYTRIETPELGSGQRVESMQDLAPLMNNPRFREGIEAMERREGHTKAIRVVMHGGTASARYSEAENAIAVRAQERKANGYLDNTKTLIEMGVDDLSVAQALGVST